MTSMHQFDRHSIRAARASGFLIGGVAASLATTCTAQDATTPPAPVIQKPMYIEWGITAAMVALVLFVVCRKSNRT
ncbi:hypothetical protein SH668x_000794 [Planctomicrobium sp. SH668]|uniref:hypothetical protein n=1 Tax=Planctomicrobium sp. SH668 TaxID=3448126 RepID=UPI003F5B1AC0